MTHKAPNQFVNRKQEDVDRQILKHLAKNGPTGYTRIMYETFLNAKVCNATIKNLLSKGLVELLIVDEHMCRELKISLNSKKVLFLTKKGMKYLHMLEKLDNAIDWNQHAEVPLHGRRKKERLITWAT